MDDFDDMSASMGMKVDEILGEDLLEKFLVVIIEYKHQRPVLSR